MVQNEEEEKEREEEKEKNREKYLHGEETWFGSAAEQASKVFVVSLVHLLLRLLDVLSEHREILHSRVNKR